MHSGRISALDPIAKRFDTIDGPARVERQGAYLVSTRGERGRQVLILAGKALMNEEDIHEGPLDKILT
jgi:hypothetical protein